MHHPSLVEADRERVRAELLRAENLPFASPAVLQHVLDEAAERAKAVETLRELLAHPLAGSQPEEAAAARALLESLGESA